MIEATPTMGFRLLMNQITTNFLDYRICDMICVMTTYNEA
jgi:hypothetical protein